MTLRKLTLAVTLITLLAGCDNQPEEPANVSAPAMPQARYQTSAEQSSAFVSHLGLSAYTAMSMAAQDAQELDSRLQSFLYHPNPMSLKEVRDAWREAYSAFLQTLIYSRLPISDPPDWYKKGIDYRHTLILLDSWPIEGGYIDHVPGYPFSGIVNDLTLELNEDSLLAQHGFSDPSYASVGYHAFEFMLWGEDGQRSARDFFPQENTAPVVMPGEGTAANGSADSLTAGVSQEAAHGDEEPAGAEAGDIDIQNHNRRRQYVQLLSDLLQKHLHRLQRRWEPSNGYYATLLQRSAPDQVLAATLNATRRLLSDELLAKRLNGDSSGFSHTSQADIAAILHGIRNLYLPDSETEGTAGLQELLPASLQDGLISDWSRHFALIDNTLAQWQQEGDASEATRQQCRERIIELMSVLKRTADALNLPLSEDDD